MPIMLAMLAMACVAGQPSPAPPTSTATPTPPMPESTAARDWVWLDELPRGRHAVGYHQRWFEDPTRSLVEPETGETIKRPIVIAVWYPSDDPTSGQAMRVDDYLAIEAPAGGPWRARLERHVHAVREREVFDGQPSDALAELPTMARREAAWAGGRFPLVLVHPGLGGSFSDNFVLWEHLASHGFVVVAGAFMAASGLSPAIEWDPSTSITDLDRMFEVAATWANVDATRAVVIGHSYGAQAALAYAMAGRDVVAVVSLDSTLEYADPAAPWYEQAEPARYLGERESLQVPALIVHAGGRTNYVEGLIHADRSLASLPELRHDDFIAHGGVLRARHSDHANPLVRRRYGELAEAIRQFLLGVTAPTPSVPDLGPGWTHLAAEPPPPDLAVIVAWIREFGPAQAWARCVDRPDCDAEVLVNDAGYVLMRLGATTLADEVFATVVERTPSSWNAWDSWAESAAKQGAIDDAIVRYREALARLSGEAEAQHGPRIRAAIAELEAQR